VTDPESDPAHDLTPRQAIRLEHVIYRYPGAESDALTDVTLEIRPGASIGIVGPTGGGKSTLVDVILGLLPPTAGRVLADDVDISLDVGSWQAHLGVVPQTVYLLDTTLRRNIALGFDDAAIDDGLVEEAVRVAQLDGVVASLPNGLDTEVGERGIRFSGGQRQRVAIARALYRRPAVLVLDEGTSALDAVTEAALLKALAAADRHRSLIIVAHRLTSIQHCDEVLFVEGGQVVDIGPYEALVDRNPAFRRMAQATLTSQASVHARDG
jgi:ATP-binding cassette subfamily C protein